MSWARGSVDVGGRRSDAGKQGRPLEVSIGNTAEKSFPRSRLTSQRIGRRAHPRRLASRNTVPRRICWRPRLCSAVSGGRNEMTARSRHCAALHAPTRRGVVRHTYDVNPMTRSSRDGSWQGHAREAAARRWGRAVEAYFASERWRTWDGLTRRERVSSIHIIVGRARLSERTASRRRRTAFACCVPVFDGAALRALRRFDPAHAGPRSENPCRPLRRVRGV
jgi:hypothetical protein